MEAEETQNPSWLSFLLNHVLFEPKTKFPYREHAGDMWKTLDVVDLVVPAEGSFWEFGKQVRGAGVMTGMKISSGAQRRLKPPKLVWSTSLLYDKTEIGEFVFDEFRHEWNWQATCPLPLILLQFQRLYVRLQLETLESRCAKSCAETPLMVVLGSCDVRLEIVQLELVHLYDHIEYSKRPVCDLEPYQICNGFMGIFYPNDPELSSSTTEIRDWSVYPFRKSACTTN